MSACQLGQLAQVSFNHSILKLITDIQTIVDRYLSGKPGTPMIVALGVVVIALILLCIVFFIQFKKMKAHLLKVKQPAG